VEAEAVAAHVQQHGVIHLGQRQPDLGGARVLADAGQYRMSASRMVIEQMFD
jgi:hypothetical protein